MLNDVGLITSTKAVLKRGSQCLNHRKNFEEKALLDLGLLQCS